MGGMNAWPVNIDAQSWMRDVEKRILTQERRGTVSEADLFGPGFDTHSVELLDWNDDAALANGFWYSEPGAINTPDSSTTSSARVWWMGRSQGIDLGLGYGLQWATAFRPPDASAIDTPIPQSTFLRRFYDPGPSGTQSPFTPWQIEDGNPIGTVIGFAGPVVPNGYLYCDGSVYDPVLWPILYQVIGVFHGGTASSPLLPDMTDRFPRAWTPTATGLLGGNDAQAPGSRSVRHSHTIPDTIMQDIQNTQVTAGGSGRLTSAAGNITHAHGGATGLSTVSAFPYFFLGALIKAG
jgi:microcystin-dependent protein